MRAKEVEEVNNTTISQEEIRPKAISSDNYMTSEENTQRTDPDAKQEDDNHLRATMSSSSPHGTRHEHIHTSTSGRGTTPSGESKKSRSIAGDLDPISAYTRGRSLSIFSDPNKKGETEKQ
jgi:hypothetical protein